MLNHHRPALNSLGLIMNCSSYPIPGDSYVHFHELKPIQFMKKYQTLRDLILAIIRFTASQAM